MKKIAVITGLLLGCTVLFFTGCEPFDPQYPDFEPEEGKIGTLFVVKSHYWRSPMGQRRQEVEMSFLEPGAPGMHNRQSPEDFGADSFALEYSVDGEQWEAYQGRDGDLIITSDNIILGPDGDYYYRLRVIGGEKDGYTSNVVYAYLAEARTQFTGWGTSNNLSHPDAPYKKVHFKVEFGTDYEEYLSYQWYRVNPVTLSKKRIEGATDKKYYVKDEDHGWAHIVRATGDEVNVGGFSQVICYAQAHEFGRW